LQQFENQSAAYGQLVQQVEHTAVQLSAQVTNTVSESYNGSFLGDLLAYSRFRQSEIDLASRGFQGGGFGGSPFFATALGAGFQGGGFGAYPFFGAAPFRFPGLGPFDAPQFTGIYGGLAATSPQFMPIDGKYVGLGFVPPDVALQLGRALEQKWATEITQEYNTISLQLSMLIRDVGASGNLLNAGYGLPGFGVPGSQPGTGGGPGGQPPSADNGNLGPAVGGGFGGFTAPSGF
jgi:hypothetical protein